MDFKVKQDRLKYLLSMYVIPSNEDLAANRTSYSKTHTMFGRTSGPFTRGLLSRQSKIETTLLSSRARFDEADPIRAALTANKQIYTKMMKTLQSCAKKRYDAYADKLNKDKKNISDSQARIRTAVHKDSTANSYAVL